MRLREEWELKKEKRSELGNLRLDSIHTSIVCKILAHLVFLINATSYRGR